MRVIISLLWFENFPLSALESIESIEQAQESLSLNMPLDIISIDIKDAVERLAEITGENVTEEVIDGIFSRFCLGK